MARGPAPPSPPPQPPIRSVYYGPGSSAFIGLPVVVAIVISIIAWSFW